MIKLVVVGNCLHGNLLFRSGTDTGAGTVLE